MPTPVKRFAFFKRKRSVKTTFILALILFSLFQSVLIGGLSAYRLIVELEEQYRDRVIALTENIAQEAFFSAFLQQGSGLASMVKGLVDKDVIYAQIVIKGEVAAEDNPLEVALPVERVLGGVHLKKRRLDGLAYLDLTRTLLGRPEDKDQDSYIRMGMSLAYVEYELKQELTLIAELALGVILLGIGLAFGLSKVMLSPLDRLSEAVQRFGKRHFEARAPQFGWREINGLSKEFNTMAEAIVSMKTQLEKDSQAKSEFLTIVGHELRTPLHAILGYAELLNEQIGGTLTPEQRRQVRCLGESGEHLLELVESILHYAKLEMGQESLHRTDVDVATLVHEALDLMRPLAEKEGLTLHVSGDTGHLQADRIKLKEVLLNLLQNAVRYTSGGSVCVEVERRATAWTFHVVDEGPGIVLEDQDKVFEAFVQSQAAEKHSIKGLGLGLNIVKRYTELHGGKVTLSSTPGKGCRFSVTLPQPTTQEVDRESADRRG